MTQSLFRHFKAGAFYLSIFLFCFGAKAQVRVNATAATTGPTNYTTLKAAFDAVNAGTHQGSISIIITANTTETTTASLNASGAGPASYSSVIVKPEAGTTPVISGNISNGPLIKCNGSRNFTIDGSNNGTTSRNLTITNTSTANSNVLLIGSIGTTPISNVTIKNGTLINGANTSTAVSLGDATTVGNPGYFNNITIQNNSIQKAYIGLYGYAIVSAGNGNNTLLTGNDIDATGANAIKLVGVYLQGLEGATVSNNNIGNFESAGSEFDRAIWLATGTINSTVSDNTIYNMAYTGTSTYAPIGINISAGFANANITVAGNTIRNLSSSGSGNTMGIFSYSASSGIIFSGNQISNIKNTNTAGYGATGIVLANNMTNAATKVYNNFVWDIAGYGFNGYDSNDNGNGIVVDGGGGYNIDFNTVILNTEQRLTGGHRSSCLLITNNVTTSGTINVRNNIFGNLQTTGNTTSRMAISNIASPGSGVFGTINYNSYYSASGNLSSTGTNASISNTLSQLKTSLGGNANSVNVNPILTSANDLHLMAPQPQLTATAIAGITTDIDAEVRSATSPYMGADEYDKRIVPDANGIVYVKKGSIGSGLSWAYAASELADALIAAKTNTAIKEIWVAKGTYKPMYSPEDGPNFGTDKGRDNAFVLVKDVKVYGGFAGTETDLSQRDLSITTNKSTLSGDFNDDDVITGTGSTLNISGNTENAYHVLVSAGAVGNAVLNGFTITGGYGASGIPLFVNTFRIYRNTGGGMLNTNTSSPTITNCIFINNMVKGGSGGAMYNYLSATPLVMNCSFVNNFASNTSGQGWGDEGGGGMYNLDSAPIIVNCTFYGNLATGDRSGGAINSLNSNLSVTNSIVANNSASASNGIYSLNGTLVVRYSLVQDMPADVTTHNLDGTADPLFTNPAIGAYTLKSGSPAINSGSNALYEAADGNAGNNSLGLDKDLAGNPRLTGGTIDIGAYELQSQPQTITAVNITKTYGDAPFLPGATASSNLEVSYTSADNAIAEAFQDAADGNKWKLSIKKAGTVNVTASQAGNNGFDPATDVVFSLTINKKPVTVNIKAGAAFSKVYDASTAGTFQASNLEFIAGAIIGSDEVLLSLGSGAAQYDSRDAGIGKTITLPIANVLLSGAQAGNYSIANVLDLSSNTAIITPMPLTITANNASKVYDGFAYTGGNGVSYSAFALGESAVQLSGTLTYGGTAQNALNTGTYSIIPAGLSSANYAITYVNGQLIVSLNNVNTLTFNAQTSGSTLIKTYGDANINASAIASSGLAANYLSNNTSVATVNAAGQVTLLAPGTAIITVNQLGDTNYGPATPITFQVQVAKKVLTVTANDFSKTYDGIPYAGGNGLNYEGFVNGDTPLVLNGTLTYSGTSQGAVNTGAYPIVPAGLISDNYDFDYKNGTLSIIPSGANVITFNAQVSGATQQLIYGQGSINGSAIASSGLTVIYSSSNPAVATVAANGSVQILTAGTATITASQPGDINHTAATSVSFSINVQKKALTITARNANKTYDGLVYSGGAGVTYTGFITGENESSLQGTLTYTGTAQGAKDVGSYFISPTGYTSGNYAITYYDGSLTIIKADVTVTAVGQSKIYGGADPALTYTFTPNLITGNTFTGSLSRAAGENVGDYAIGIGTLAVGGNYNISYTGANFVVTKAILTTTASNTQMCQGNRLPVFTITYTGFKYNDNESSLHTKATVNTTASSSSAAGNYTLIPSGAVSGNYSFNYVNGTLIINALPVVAINSNRGTSISKGETVVLTASGGVNYSWTSTSGTSTGQNTPALNIRPDKTTTYTVTAFNANGCSQTSSITIEVKDDFQAVQANNILTPNGDSYNDVWVVNNIDMYPNNEVKIFDRAGRLVYSKRGYDNSWDGTENGQPLGENTYYYIIDFGSTKLSQKGYITLIRSQ
ncbi:hypothetical protein D3C87_167460 [compost metagenome]